MTTLRKRRLENLASTVAGESEELAQMLPAKDAELAAALRAITEKLDKRFALVTLSCPVG